MLYKTFEVEDLINLKESDREVVDLMEKNGAHLKLMAMKKHQILEPHMAHTNVCIYLVDGEIEIKFTHNDNCACQACGCEMDAGEKDDFFKFKIKKGQLFFFEKDVMHSVEALKDSYFLIVKI